MRFKFHHGDLDFFQVDELPAKYKLVKKGVLTHTPQQSPATGNAHVISSDMPFDVYQAQDFAYVFGGIAIIQHNEHRTLTFEPGTYLLEREKEEDPTEGVVREVID